MLHRHAVAACAALSAVGAFALAQPAGAAPADPPAATVPAPAPAVSGLADSDGAAPGVLDALRRDLGLTDEQARARLRNEAEAGARAGRLRNALGSRYAGAWVSGQTAATLTVATTDATDSTTIKAAGAETRVVRHGLAALESAKARLDRQSARTRTAEAPVWYVDPRTNTVTLEATRPAAAEVLLDAAGVDRSLVRTVAVKERPRALYDLRGGDAFHIGGGRCSIGFSVVAGSRQGFVTAGHCGSAGDATTGFNKAAQGSFQASTFPGKDMAWVEANADWTATPYVKGQGGANVEVSGSTEALVGASVCRSGSTTGWHCGTVEQHDTSVSYLEGTVRGLTRTTVCAEPGDSGGSYISGAQAQGVTSGGSGDCVSGGTTYHQPVNPILKEFGLTLKTSAPDAGETGKAGTWAAGKVYDTGDQVTYDGASYRCLQPHQAQSGRGPSVSPALWQRA
ncbi:alpha-lytic protease prodomain-containing protein [Streptomyces sp. NPDC047097]|uniref:alpha-lytic protease prodomain-containing protein n=1 Tax=Streptomyces sp. NPDC047097 TaxID=3155260 RepID=UPI0033E44DC6